MDTIADLSQPSASAISDPTPRWELRHRCGGIARRVTMAGHAAACLDCGEAVVLFAAEDVATGAVVVLEDGELRVADQ